jgi:hypothetical protein
MDLNMRNFIINSVMKALLDPAFHNTHKKYPGNNAKGYGHYYHQASFFVTPYVLPCD